MFEHPINPFHSSDLAEECCSEKNAYARRYNTAISLFKSAIVKGSLFRLYFRVVRRQSSLFDLNQIKPHLSLHGSSYAGLKVVRIRSIIGTEGKSSDFDLGFHPRTEAARQRWVGMAMAYLSCLPLPPVQLIQIGDAYFVRDGHHRISVARALGQTCVDAEVVTWNASPPFPWQPAAAPERSLSWKRANLST